MSTLCFVERESVHSCILLNEGVGFAVFVRNVRPLWIRGSQKAVEWGEPESDLMRFQALAGSGLPSGSARNSSHLALRASSESRLTSPHAARYSTRFDCTVRLRVLRCLMASRRAGVDHGLAFLPDFDFPTCFAAAKIMALLRRRMRWRRFISCTWKERTDSSTASENACQLDMPGQAKLNTSVPADSHVNKVA